MPSAASTAPRTALFMRTGRNPLAITSGAGLPVAASTNEPPSCLMNSALSALRNSNWFACNAVSTAAACGWPDNASASTPRRIESKLVDASAANASSADCARPETGASTSTAIINSQATRFIARFQEDDGGGPGRRRATPWGVVGSGHQAFLPPPAPHLPVFTLNAPQDSGARQSPIRSLVSSTYGDHSCATTRPGVCQTVLNWPSA